MTAILPAILSLAAVDSLNPTSITAAIYLAGSRQSARLRLFIVAVYCTYLSIGLALLLGPAPALRSALGATPAIVAPVVEVVVGGLLVGMGIRTWRRRGFRRDEPARAARSSSRSGLVLGFLTTLADLPTAGPLLAATALLAGLTGWRLVTGLGLYDLVYISPLLAIALARCRITATTDRPSALRRGLLAYAPRSPRSAWPA